MDVIKESPYQWVTNRDGYRTLLRTKHPRFAIEVQDDADDKQIADALKKAAEFVMKGDRKEKGETPLRFAVEIREELYAVEDEKLHSYRLMGGKVLGEICDKKECDKCCFHYRGICLNNYMRMSDGERVIVKKYERY